MPFAKAAATIAFTLLTAALALPAAAQTGGNRDAQAAVAVRSPQYFANAAAKANLLLIQASQAAVSKAQSQPIKALANLMLEDYRKMQFQLRRDAEDAKLKVPFELEAQDRATLERLNAAAKGSDFDKAWLGLQRQAHWDVVELYAAYAKKGDNKALKSMAGTDEVILRQHLQQLQQIGAP